MPGHEGRELSRLVRWSQSSGAMWLHMFLSSGFNDHRSFPFTQLRQHLGTEWAKRENELSNEEELEAFAARKMRELEKCDEAMERREEDKALVDNGKMTKEEFIAASLSKTETSESKDDKGYFHRAAAWLADEMRGAASLG